jgi:hypothetical protein
MEIASNLLHRAGDDLIQLCCLNVWTGRQLGLFEQMRLVLK